MLFISYEFLLYFLPIVLVTYYALSGAGWQRSATVWLILASLFFYGYWNPPYLILLLSSIVVNYQLGSMLGSGRLERTQPNTRILLILGISFNLSLLGYFKYANFFVDSINSFTNANFHLATILLPLAISFFTFQQITYLVDAYRDVTHEHKFLNYCLFVTFFPQLIAGPIVHHKEMMPQFDRPGFSCFKIGRIGVGLAIFTLGLFKKVVLADGLSAYASPTFDAAAIGRGQIPRESFNSRCRLLKALPRCTGG